MVVEGVAVMEGVRREGLVIALAGGSRTWSVDMMVLVKFNW